MDYTCICIRQVQELEQTLTSIKRGLTCNCEVLVPKSIGSIILKQTKLLTTCDIYLCDLEVMSKKHLFCIDERFLSKIQLNNHSRVAMLAMAKMI